MRTSNGQSAAARDGSVVRAWGLVGLVCSLLAAAGLFVAGYNTWFRFLLSCQRESAAWRARVESGEVGLDQMSPPSSLHESWFPIPVFGANLDSVPLYVAATFGLAVMMGLSVQAAAAWVVVGERRRLQVEGAESRLGEAVRCARLGLFADWTAMRPGWRFLLLAPIAGWLGAVGVDVRESWLSLQGAWRPPVSTYPTELPSPWLGAVFALLYGLSRRPNLRRAFWSRVDSILRKAGSVCIGCGYDLGGASGVVCPECGLATSGLSSVQAGREVGGLSKRRVVGVVGVASLVVAVVYWSVAPRGLAMTVVRLATHARVASPPQHGVGATLVIGRGLVIERHGAVVALYAARSRVGHIVVRGVMETSDGRVRRSTGVAPAVGASVSQRGSLRFGEFPEDVLAFSAQGIGPGMVSDRVVRIDRIPGVVESMRFVELASERPRDRWLMEVDELTSVADEEEAWLKLLADGLSSD